MGFGDGIEPPSPATGVVPDQAPYVRPEPEQPLAEVASNEAARAGHEHLFPAPAHRSNPFRRPCALASTAGNSSAARRKSSVLPMSIQYSVTGKLTSVCPAATAEEMSSGISKAPLGGNRSSKAALKT